MARVPATIPAEPGESRCGDSYKEIVYANGLIPETDFGKQFEHRIDQVKLQGTGLYPSPAVPLFESEAAMREETEAPGGLKDRLNAIDEKVYLDNWAYNEDDTQTLKEIVRRGRRLLRGANIEMRIEGHEDEARQDIEEAVRHLRCAEYWVWRIFLYRQALEAYEPPEYPTIVLTPPPSPGLGIPPLDEEPPDGEPPDGEPLAKRKEEEKKVSPWLIAGGLAVAGGLVYYFVLRKK